MNDNNNIQCTSEVSKCPSAGGECELNYLFMREEEVKKCLLRVRQQLTGANFFS